MEIILPNTIEQEIKETLRKAGSRETGGILMGEHVGPNRFKITSITFQNNTGGIFSFRRVIYEIIHPLHRFFNATSHDYQNFNYLGEWHSHPSFALEPSVTDCNTMWDIVEDPEVGANFAVLLIVKLVADYELHGSVTIFTPKTQKFSGILISEELNAI